MCLHRENQGIKKIQEEIYLITRELRKCHRARRKKEKRLEKTSFFSSSSVKIWTVKKRETERGMLFLNTMRRKFLKRLL